MNLDYNFNQIQETLLEKLGFAKLREGIYKIPESPTSRQARQILLEAGMEENMDIPMRRPLQSLGGLVLEIQNGL